MNPKLTEIQSSPTTESAMIPKDHPWLAAYRHAMIPLDHPWLAAYRHLMGIPDGIDQPLSASSHSYALDAPTRSHVLDGPTRSHVLDGPTRSHVLDAPTLSYAPAPTHSHVLDAPTLSYALDAQTLVYALDAPTGSYVLDAPTHTHALDAPRCTYALDARAMTATTADVQDLPAAYVFVVDMPGVGSAELKVQVENDNVLVISGKRKREEGAYLCMERRLGKLTKMFMLPKNANTEAVSAVCKDGVITVTVEKRPPQETKKPKAVEVKIA